MGAKALSLLSFIQPDVSIHEYRSRKVTQLVDRFQNWWKLTSEKLTRNVWINPHCRHYILVIWLLPRPGFKQNDSRDGRILAVRDVNAGERPLGVVVLHVFVSSIVSL